MKSSLSKPKNKYGAQKVVDPLYGTFDSKGEYQHFHKLRMLMMAGEIESIERQVRFDFIVNDVKVGSYTADFVFIQNGKLIVQDYKGAYRLPPDVPLRMKLMKALHGIDVEIVGRHKK